MAEAEYIPIGDRAEFPGLAWNRGGHIPIIREKVPSDLGGSSPGGFYDNFAPGHMFPGGGPPAGH